MIYWSSRKKALVFSFENQPTSVPTKVYLTKEGWSSDNASSKLVEKCKLIYLEVKHLWLKRFSYSLGKEGVAVCLTTERIKVGKWGEPTSDVWKCCNSNLYNLVGLKLDPSVKSNSECKGEINRKLTEQEKAYLKEVYSSDLEFED